MDASPPDIGIIVAVVYDDDAILDALQLLLAASGWKVRTYRSGETFVDDLSENTPDCLVLDSHLPGLSGADVARALSTRYPNIPIIGITAQHGSRLANEVLSAGANAMLTTPIDAELILSKVQNAIS